MVKKARVLGSTKLFEVFALCFIAITTLAVKGVSGEGQSGLFGSFLAEYIEETTTITRLIAGNSQEHADSNSLVNFNVAAIGGQSAPQSKSIELSTVQDNAVIAYTPATEDYLDSVGFRRNGVVDYEVQEGDRLTFIASDFGVSISSIYWANNLRDDTIRPGQKLRIPPVSGVIHKVKKGDTLSSVAKRYGADTEEIIAFNSLPKTGNLDIGDEIVVPDGTMKLPVTGTTVANRAAVRQFSYLPDLGVYFTLPTVGFNWGKIHGRNGVDMANSCGTPIKAAAAGTVAVADDIGWNGGFGKFIKIAHGNGTETLYAHAAKLLVQVGQEVGQGGTIALMGTTGRSTGCHLHFEVHGARNPLAKY